MIGIYKYSLSGILFFIFSVTAWAQNPLPDIQASRENNMNILSWYCQYDGIKSIAVLRSRDSIYNFTTIGYVKNLKKGLQGYVDGHPLPGNNWYKLYIVFNSDLTWHSNLVKLYVDSSSLMKQAVLPPNDSLQNIINALAPGNITPTPQSYSYTRSQYVFTNPYTGHINIELAEKFEKAATYSIQFFNAKNQKVLEISRISEASVILDKRNFQRKGIFRFELFKNKHLLEEGHVTIY